jgi:two-component system, response regulator PdtaR
MNSDSEPAVATDRLRILIVEDEVLVSMFLSDVLMDLGHTVTGTAPSMDAALQLAAQNPSDLALVDVGLAGAGDGIEAARALRERYGVRSVFMSGASQDVIAARAESVQSLGVLMKPYTETDVQRALAAAASKLQHLEKHPH